MTKNSEYIIPKVEIASEAKDEYKVPAYEEFMKDYESGTNYADLEDSDISEVGGYGPCYKNCNYANPNCECYISASDGRYVPLYLVCPAPRYEKPYCTNKEPGMWTHSICGGGRVYINTNLMIKCMKPGCGRSFKATDAAFACSTHESEYSKASKSEFGNALTGLNSMWKNKSPTIRIYIEKMIEKQLQEEGFYYE